MVRMIIEYGPGSIDLLHYDDAHQRMRKSQRRQRPAVISSRNACRIQTVGPTHQERDVAAKLHPLTQAMRELASGEFAAVLAQRDDVTIARYTRQQQIAFSLPDLCRVSLLAV